MNKLYLQLNAIVKNLFFVLVVFFLQINLTYANDDAAIKAVFLKYSKMQFGDTIAAPWRIVQAKTWKEALANKKSILEGMSSDASVVKFSVAQREKLYQAWQKTPQDIWVIYFSQPEHLELIKEAGHYYIDLVMSQSDADVAQNAAAEKIYNEGQKPLSKTIYTQAGFDAKPFNKDYADWQKRFMQDTEEFNAKMRKDKEYGRKIVVDKNQDALKQAFGNSIDSGEKGLSLRAELISAYYASPGHEGTEVTPSGMVFSQLVLAKNAKPVGYGGMFSDENTHHEKTRIELWYMVFDDMTDWKVSDFNDSLVFSAFAHNIKAASADAAATPSGETEAKPNTSQAQLPPYESIKRNSWPALVFTREADGKVKLYGMPMEMAQILGNIWNKQLF